MKIKFNYFFFVALFVAPLIGALIALPYGLFMASTPYYFSWPFRSFWQEFFTLVVIIIFLYSLLFGYIALPWLAVIRDDKIVFHRLFRKKLVIMYKDVKRLEILSKKLPIETNKNGLGNLVFTMKDENKHVVVAVPHYVSIELKKKLRSAVEEYYRKITDEEFDKYAVGKKK